MDYFTERFSEKLHSTMMNFRCPEQNDFILEKYEKSIHLKQPNDILQSMDQMLALNNDEMKQFLLFLRKEIHENNRYAAIIYLKIMELFSPFVSGISTYRTVCRHPMKLNEHIFMHYFDNDLDALAKALKIAIKNMQFSLAHAIVTDNLARRRQYHSIRFLVDQHVNMDSRIFSATRQHLFSLLDIHNLIPDFSIENKKRLLSENSTQLLLKCYTLGMKKDLIQQVYESGEVPLSKFDIDHAPLFTKMFYGYIMHDEPVYLLQNEYAQYFPIPDNVKTFILALRRMQKNENVPLPKIDPFVIEEMLAD